ncbi:hypothetical protein V1477_010334 [Vespula maculifrons]|uniref:Uncharacterized protein n=1 Tax=Vespula maculifrons TaxID=7453 RepID=A0ABD2CAF5_VESMC
MGYTYPKRTASTLSLRRIALRTIISGGTLGMGPKLWTLDRFRSFAKEKSNSIMMIEGPIIVKFLHGS